MDHLSASSLFRAVADPVRLRILHLLQTEELSVGELVRILELPQSSVSRHLKALRDESLLIDRASGPATYYRAALNGEHYNGQGRLRQTLAEILPADELPSTDRSRLDRVLALRTSDNSQFFDRIGLQWDALRESCFGTSFHLEAFLTLLPPTWTVADLGTGTGYLLPHLARHFQRVIAVDASAPMLELAEKRIRQERTPDAGNVEFHEGRLESLPIADASVDLSLMVLMLHHLPELDSALAELGRITRLGGQVLIVDFLPHENAPFQARMADESAGTDPKDLSSRLAAAGFTGIRQHPIGQPYLPDHELGPLPQLYAITARSEERDGTTSFRPATPKAASTNTTTSKTRKGNAQ